MKKGFLVRVSYDWLQGSWDKFFGNRSSFFEFWSEVLDSWLLDMCMVYYNEFMFVRGFS